MTQNAPHFYPLWVWMLCGFPTGILTEIFVVYVNKFILPFKTGGEGLPVSFGDSSPGGRARKLPETAPFAVTAKETERIGTDTLR